jgi:hypothetical protein
MSLLTYATREKFGQIYSVTIRSKLVNLAFLRIVQRSISALKSRAVLCGELD